MYISHYTSPIGELIMTSSDGESLSALWIKGEKYSPSDLLDEPCLNDLKIFQTTTQWLDEYFAGNAPSISQLNLNPEGSDFRKSVWKILCRIPYGQTTTYGAIAKEIAKERNLNRMSAQAIGGAVGHNPVSIIIPCHRVIGSDGSLTGYAGGLDIKIKLLTLEGADIGSMHMPKK